MPILLKTQLPEVRLRNLRHIEELRSCWNSFDYLMLPDGEKPRRYRVGFACSQQGVERALRLRYEVFNLELEEGLAASHRTGLDEDEFDPQMTHLVLLDRETLEVAGTYRLQTAAQALARLGFYSAREYDLAGLAPYFGGLVECGRACVGLEHRSLAAVMQLWQGIITFCRMHRQRWLFGCCSLTSQDPRDGWRALQCLKNQGSLDDELRLPATRAFSCQPAMHALTATELMNFRLPKLFSAYVRLGAKVISEPAIDREFGTVDFLILQDALALSLSSLER